MTEMSKYGNRKVATTDGIIHDSQKEAARWSQLKLLERAGEITDLQRQVKYELVPPQKGERAVFYIADFVYTDVRTGNTVVEDTKGFRTKDYIIKRKLLLYFHGLRVTET